MSTNYMSKELSQIAPPPDCLEHHGAYVWRPDRTSFLQAYLLAPRANTFAWFLINFVRKS